MLMVIVFGAHEFPELSFAVLLPVPFPGTSALDPNKKYPDAEGHGKVWKGVSFMQSAQHSTCGNQAGEDKKKEGSHNV
jgi:hypothetical protein